MGMNEPKPFASLTGSILARKGSARPAMRPQTAPLHYDASSAARQLEEDLGWNDMGDLSDMVDFSEPDETTNFSARGGKLDLSGLSSMTELNDAANDAVAEASVGYAALEQFEALEEYEEDPESLEAAFEPIEAEIEPIEAVIEPIEAEIVTLIPNASPPPAERPEVLRQQDEVVERFAAPSRKRGQRRPAATEGRRAAFTLRLDAERHLQLRLACTLTGKSAQQLVTDALDKLISELPDVSALAVKVSEGRQ
jgi:hypothetical protein